MGKPRRIARRHRHEAQKDCLLVDKPAGVTSHDMVVAARRAYGERSIGHLGTLDPFATGLLVLLLGRATRLATFIDTEPKIYDATIRFGTETDTDDSTGTVVRSAPEPDPQSVTDAIATLTGTILQVPPAYSAKSVDGERATMPLVVASPSSWSRLRDRSRGGSSANSIPSRSGRRLPAPAEPTFEALPAILGRITRSAGASRVTSPNPLRSLRNVRDAASLENLRNGPPRLRNLLVVSSDA